MTQFDNFRRSSLDTTGIGLAPEPETSGNLFTPLGAALIGWTGRNNAHFCFLEGFGETVFAVDPGCCFGQFVYPVAKSFPEFLGLILACRGTEAMEMAWRWSRLRFEAFLKEQSLSYKQRSILRAIRNTYAPPEIADPFSYLMAVRQGFDGTGLQFSPELAGEGFGYPSEQGFPVTFGAGARERPGKEIPLEKTFSWGDGQWRIPALYSCKEGLVLDLCVQLPQERFRAGSPDPGFQAGLTLNGKRLSEKRERRAVWDPWGDNEWEALRLLNHYGCDRETGWIFLRKSFPWYAKRRPAVQSLVLSLQAKPVTVPGPQFQAPPVGESVVLAHPVTGQSYTLTVTDYAQEELDSNFLYDLPKHYTVMGFRLSPELPDGVFSVRDCGESDPAPENTSAGDLLGADPPPDSGASIGIIGGADGPTAVFLAKPGTEGHCACSAFHYMPQEQVTWRMDFKEKPWEDLSLELIR